LKQLEDGETWCGLNKKLQREIIIDWLLVKVKILAFYSTHSKGRSSDFSSERGWDGMKSLFFYSSGSKLYDHNL